MYFSGLELKGKEPEAALLAIHNGAMTPQPGAQHFEERFEPLRKSIRGGVGELFDHSLRMEYYQKCFVGRDRESRKIINWVFQENVGTLLKIYSPAGMGKGALLADVIHRLRNYEIDGKRAPVPVLYHFCGSGAMNHLQAVLYHLILQGKALQIWDEQAADVDLNKMPGEWDDVISTFQRLLENGFKKPRRSATPNLVVIVDALDEADVANRQCTSKTGLR